MRFLAIRASLLIGSLLLASLMSHASAQAASDCVGYQEMIDLSRGTSTVTMEYTVELSDPEDTSDFPQGTLSVRLTYEGQAWLGFAISETPGRMTGGEAVMARPAEPPSSANPGKYRLDGKLPQLVVPFPESARTLINASLEQTADRTILTFTKLLVEPDEIPIDANGVNSFMWAHGFNNALVGHQQKGAFTLNLRPCNAATPTEGEDVPTDFSDVDLPDRYQTLWKAHGWLAGIAWGVLTPLAIAAALLRDFIPSTWLTFHMAFNITTYLLTLASFGCAVAAQEKSTPEGQSPNHFSTAVAHRTVGLVLTILVFIQIMGGVFRPHVPEKQPPTDEEADDLVKEPQTSTARLSWEVGHKFAGFALLGLSAWQVQEGLTLYANRFSEKDLTPVFWGVFGGILGVAVTLHLYSRFCRNKERADE